MGLKKLLTNLDYRKAENNPFLEEDINFKAKSISYPNDNIDKYK